MAPCNGYPDMACCAPTKQSGICPNKRQVFGPSPRRPVTTLEWHVGAGRGALAR